jgi:lipopolysaccharide/colanic/teichoic acid biosynthesis glycosyltransferase
VGPAAPPQPGPLALRARYKRPLDLLILIGAHLALAPLWLALWTLIPLLIWLGDRGPVFYAQQRAGRGGRPFAVLKFRTMVVDADKIGPVWTEEDDPRITPVGRFLRKTALDELPSLLSIWRGDMSLVGPRALAVAEQLLLEERFPGFAARLAVPPGLTGLSQVYNSADDNELKLRYDLEYIRRMSPWLDVQVILLSVRNTLTGRWDTRAGKDSGAD